MNKPVKLKFKTALILLAVIIFSGSFVSCASDDVNLSGNASNYGYVLVDGDDIYYTKVIIKNETEFYSNIYKCSAGNKDDEILISSLPGDSYTSINAYLTLDGGYLYFLANFLHNTDAYSDNIYRIKPDGKNTEPERLFDESISCSFMYISKGTIYYYDENEYALYKVNTDGTKKELLCEALAGCIAAGGDKIYFAELYSLMSISVNGGEPEEIYNFEQDGIYLKSLILDGDYLYYKDDDSYSVIGRITTNGTDNTKIYEVEGDSYAYIQGFNVSGGVVYFILDDYGENEDYAVLSITPGSRTTKLIVSDENELGDIGPISIWGDTMYFIGMPSYETIMDSNEVWFTVKTSGGKITPFKPLNVKE